MGPRSLVQGSNDGKELREGCYTRRSEAAHGVCVAQQFLDPFLPCREQPVRPGLDPTAGDTRGLSQLPGALPIEPVLKAERVNTAVFTDGQMCDLVSGNDWSPKWSHPLEPWNLDQDEIVRLIGAARLRKSAEQEVAEGQRARYEVVGSAWRENRATLAEVQPRALRLDGARSRAAGRPMRQASSQRRVAHEAEVSEVLPQHRFDRFRVGVIEPFGHEGSDRIRVAAGYGKGVDEWSSPVGERTDDLIDPSSECLQPDLKGAVEFIENLITIRPRHETEPLRSRVVNRRAYQQPGAQGG